VEKAFKIIRRLSEGRGKGLQNNQAAFGGALYERNWKLDKKAS